MTEQFEKAVKESVLLKTRPTYTEIGDLYGFYKQGTVGDVNTERPPFYDLKGRGKWDAWEARKGLGKEEAKSAYVDVVEKLKAKYGMEQ